MAIDLLDKTANANNLTNNGASEWLTSTPFAAPNTTAVSLVAAESDYLAADDSASLSVTGDCSFECWVLRDSIGSFMTMVGKDGGSGSGQRSYRLAFLADNTIRWDTWSDGVESGASAASTGTITSTTVWHHVAITFTASTKVVLFYIDGALDTTSSAQVSGVIFNGTNEMAIGRSAAGASVQFDGKIDEVRIWGDVRSGAEITANYNIRLTGAETDLAAYYPFESLQASGSSGLQGKYWG